MEPLIRNIKDFPAGTPARLISADDNPALVTLAYSVIEPGGTSSHHIHEWEHEVYIIEGSGTLVADGKEYPVKAGDAMFIPPMVDHVTRNDGGDGNIRRIEINPISAASGNARPGGSEPGAGTPPVIRNHADLNAETGHTMLGGRDGCPTTSCCTRRDAARRGEPSRNRRAQPRMGPHSVRPGGYRHPGDIG